MDNSTLQIIKENEELKRKLKLYEISTKIDYEKIERLKDEIIFLKSKMRLEPNTNKNI